MAARRNEWRRRHLILPPGLVTRLSMWHGGQGSWVYALASTGAEHYVSRSMVDAAASELARLRSHANKFSRLQKLELKRLIGDLDNVSRYWNEFSSEEAGAGRGEGYDGATYSLIAKDEALLSARPSA